MVGTMSAAFAPLGRLIAAVVLDAHDEAYHAEAAPTWYAWRLSRNIRDAAVRHLLSCRLARLSMFCVRDASS